MANAIPETCNSYSCQLNLNRLVLNGSGTFQLSAKLAKEKNKTLISELAPILYNGEYYYVGPSARNVSK